MTQMMKPFVIGVGGPSCGGKSTVCGMIGQKVGRRIVILSQDRYYNGGNKDTNFDIPSALDFNRLINDLKELKKGHAVKVPRYDFKTHSRMVEEDLIDPAPIIIVEGILIFCVPELCALFDLRVFVKADPDTCLIRRLNRDVKERGRDIDEVMNRYVRDVKPSNIEYVDPSMREADIEIPNNREGKFIGVDVLMSHIEMKLMEVERKMVVTEQ